MLNFIRKIIDRIFNNIILPCVDFNSVYIPTRENTFYEEYTWIHDPLHLLFLSKRLIFRN